MLTASDSPQREQPRRRLRPGVAVAVTGVICILIVPLLIALEIQKRDAACSHLQSRGGTILLSPREPIWASALVDETPLKLLWFRPIVELMDIRLTDTDVACVVDLPSAWYLELRGTELSDDQLAAILARHGEVDVLSVADTSVTGGCAAHLAQSNNVTLLDISGTRCTSVRAFRLIASMKSLDCLVAADLRIPEGSLRELAGCPTLESLCLVDSTVDLHDLRELMRLRPDLEIIEVEEPMEGDDDWPEEE